LIPLTKVMLKPSISANAGLLTNKFIAFIIMF
jgi:hypothetical protein